MLSVLAQKCLHSKDQYWLLREMEQTYENFSHVKIDFLMYLEHVGTRLSGISIFRSSHKLNWKLASL